MIIETGAKVKYKKTIDAEVVDVIAGQDPTLYYIRTAKGESLLCGAQQIELLENQERASSI